MACSLQGEKQAINLKKMWAVCGVKLEVFSSVKKESTCCSAIFTRGPVYICLHCAFSALFKFLTGVIRMCIIYDKKASLSLFIYRRCRNIQDF